MELETQAKDRNEIRNQQETEVGEADIEMTCACSYTDAANNNNNNNNNNSNNDNNNNNNNQGALSWPKLNTYTDMTRPPHTYTGTYAKS